MIRTANHLDFLSIFFCCYKKKLQNKEFSTSVTKKPFLKPKKAHYGYWESKENHQIFLEGFAKEFGINRWEDWYKIKTAQIGNKGGSGFLAQYKGSLQLALKTIYPQYPWKPWKFAHVPKGYWDSLEAQDFIDHKVWRLMQKRYNFSYIKALQKVYPEHNWNERLFGVVSRDYWDNIENQRKFLSELATKLNIKSHRDWYKVTRRDFVNNGAGSLLNRYKNSHINLIISIFKDEYEFQPFLFDSVPVGYWKDVKNHRIAFDYVAKNLNLKKPEDWYEVSFREIEEFFTLDAIMANFKHNFHEAIIAAYPEYNLKLWRFKRGMNNLWEDEALCKEFLEWVTKELNFTSMNDWYEVSFSQMENLGGGSLVRKYGGLHAVLQKFYPNESWEFGSANSSLAKVQQILFKTVRDVIPSNKDDMHMDYMHPELRFSSGERMELDIFIPSLSLAFEYQGAQHFKGTTSHVLYGGETRQRDEEKRKACKKIGITLIEIPFWWDLSKQSLLATIHEYRPGMQGIIILRSKDLVPTPPPGSVTIPREYPRNKK